MKKILTSLLAFALFSSSLCHSGAELLKETVSPDYSSADDMETAISNAAFLEAISKSASSDEVILIIEEYSGRIEIDTDIYMQLPDEGMHFVAGNLAGMNFGCLEDFNIAINQEVILAQLNYAGNLSEYMEILEVNSSTLGLNMEGYNALNESGRVRVVEIMYADKCYSADELQNLFIASVKKVQKPTSSGGSGGGAHADYLETYTLTHDREKLSDEPQNGTPVKLVARAVYKNEPSLLYILAEYDENGYMTAVRLHKPESTKLYESDFIEIDTKYNPNAAFKLFRFKDTESIIPLEKASKSCHYIGADLPEKEEETEGIIAVKGYITYITGSAFGLDIIDIRAHGYWNNPVPQKMHNITVNFNSQELAVLNMMDINDIVYKLVPLDDGTYDLDSIDYDGEIITFSGDSIMSYTRHSLTINYNGKTVTYEVSPNAGFSINDMSCESYYAHIKDGEIRTITGCYYEPVRVLSVSGGKALSENALSLELEMIAGTPKPGDVIAVPSFTNNIYNVAHICRPVPAVYSSENETITAGGQSYGLYYSKDIPSLIEGEKCIAYILPENNLVKLVAKDYRSEELYTIQDVALSENGNVTIIVQNGEELILTDKLYLNGVCYDKEDAFYALTEAEKPYPLYIYKCGDTMIADSPFKSRIYGNGQYSAVTSSLGGYNIRDAKLFAESGGSLYSIEDLSAGLRYQFEIYKTDSVSADAVIIRNAPASILYTPMNIVVRNITPATDTDDGSEYYVLNGYSDGEEISLRCNDFIAPDFKPGDMLSISILENRIAQATLLLSPYQSASEMVNIAQPYRKFSLPVCDISDNVIFMINGETRYAVATDAATDIYTLDMKTDEVTVSDISDIFCNPFYPESSDRVCITNPSGSELVDCIVIVKW